MSRINAVLHLQTAFFTIAFAPVEFDSIAFLCEAAVNPPALVRIVEPVISGFSTLPAALLLINGFGAGVTPLLPDTEDASLPDDERLLPNVDFRIAEPLIPSTARSFPFLGDLFEGPTFVFLPLSTPNTLLLSRSFSFVSNPPTPSSFPFCLTAFSKTNRDRGVFVVLRLPPAI